MGAGDVQRDCYCADGDTSCGTCQVCGAPGHTRAYPGPVPYTGAWCDGCYAELGGGIPLGRIVGIGLVLLFSSLAALMVWRAIA